MKLCPYCNKEMIQDGSIFHCRPCRYMAGTFTYYPPPEVDITMEVEIDLNHDPEIKD